ncbi:hypothetical protein ACIQZI_20590 [Peribacillus sp. NPDC096379]
MIELIVGIALVIILFTSTSMIEKHLKDLKQQNEQILNELKKLNNRS